MSLISFEQGETEENLIEIFARLYLEIDIYKKIGVLNSKTNNQDLTYLELLKNYIYPHLEAGELFKAVIFKQG